MNRILALLALVPMLAVTACSARTADGAQTETGSAAAAHPLSGLPVITLTVTGGGKKHSFRVEVAGSPQEQAHGLMFRTGMGADEGMIFPMNPPRQASFWMHNTVIPLDIIHIGVDGLVSNIHANTVPYSDQPLPSDGLVKAVLELNGGRAAQLGILPGSRVEW